jgi:hypothetical protein
MGGAKQQQLEFESKGLSSIRDTNLCSSHINDYAVKKFINKNSKKGFCSYCKKSKKIIPLEDLMFFLMDGIMVFYQDAAEFMSYDSSEGGYQGETYTQQELINDLVCLDVDNDHLNEDIIDCIDDRAWSEPNAYYDSESDILVYHWKYFKEVVKHKSRYLFARTSNFKTFDYNQNAYDILQEIGRHVTKFKLLITLPPKTIIFRSRQHNRSEIIKEAEQIVSPPIEFAIYPNRMSPAGISMFYNTFDLETAKLETLDLKKKDQRFITTSMFKTKTDLKIIDFTKLPQMPSIFDKKRLKDYYPLKFFKNFVSDLSSSISHDGKEHIEYVPTQIVTEFFRFVFRENSNVKIIYPSSKKMGSKACVLFFNHEESLNALTFVRKSLLTEKI